MDHVIVSIRLDCASSGYVALAGGLLMIIMAA